MKIRGSLAATIFGEKLHLFITVNVGLKQTVSCADPEGGGGQGVRTSPGKSQSYRVPYQYWPEIPRKSQNYLASNQCIAIIIPPAKRHLNGVLLAAG